MEQSLLTSKKPLIFLSFVISVCIATSLTMLASCSSEEKQECNKDLDIESEIFDQPQKDIDRLSSDEGLASDIGGNEKYSSREIPILIINGTLEEGRAAELMGVLKENGYENVATGNASVLTEYETRITYRHNESKLIAEDIARLCCIDSNARNVSFAPEDSSWPDDYELLIFLGKDENGTNEV